MTNRLYPLLAGLLPYCVELLPYGVELLLGLLGAE